MKKKETQVGMITVVKLVEPYFNTKRCVTADNFYPSIPLCNYLWEKSLQFIGTLKQNKLEMPLNFLKETNIPLEYSYDQLDRLYLHLKSF